MRANQQIYFHQPVASFVAGNHKHVRKTLEKMFRVKVKSIQLEETGYYVVTSLSSHFPIDVPLPTCDLDALHVDDAVKEMLKAEGAR